MPATPEDQAKHLLVAEWSRPRVDDALQAIEEERPIEFDPEELGAMLADLQAARPEHVAAFALLVGGLPVLLFVVLLAAVAAAMLAV